MKLEKNRTLAYLFQLGTLRNQDMESVRGPLAILASSTDAYVGWWWIPMSIWGANCVIKLDVRQSHWVHLVF